MNNDYMVNSTNGIIALDVCVGNELTQHAAEAAAQMCLDAAMQTQRAKRCDGCSNPQIIYAAHISVDEYAALVFSTIDDNGLLVTWQVIALG